MGCSSEDTCYIKKKCSIILEVYKDHQGYMVMIESIKVVCSLASFFVAYMIWTEEKLQTHPLNIIGYICLFQGGYIYAYNQPVQICATGYYRLTSWLLFPFAINAAQVDYFSFEFVIGMNRVVYRSFFMSYLVLTICYTYDLYLTIKNPLYPAKKRIRFYFAWVIISIILLQISEGYLSGDSAPDLAFIDVNRDLSTSSILGLRHNLAEMTSTWMILLLVPMLVFLIVAGRSVAKACRSFKKPGLGQHVRNVVL